MEHLAPMANLGADELVGQGGYAEIEHEAPIAAPAQAAQGRSECWERDGRLGTRHRRFDSGNDVCVTVAHGGWCGRDGLTPAAVRCYAAVARPSRECVTTLSRKIMSATDLFGPARA